MVDSNSVRRVDNSVLLVVRNSKGSGYCDSGKACVPVAKFASVRISLLFFNFTCGRWTAEMGYLILYTYNQEYIIFNTARNASKVRKFGGGAKTHRQVVQLENGGRRCL